MVFPFAREEITVSREENNASARAIRCPRVAAALHFMSSTRASRVEEDP